MRGRTAVDQRQVRLRVARCDASLCLETRECVCLWQPCSFGNRSPRKDKTLIWPRSGSRILWYGTCGAHGSGPQGNKSAQQPSQGEQKRRPSPPFRLLDGLRLPALPHKPRTPATERSCSLPVGSHKLTLSPIVTLSEYLGYSERLPVRFEWLAAA